MKCPNCKGRRSFIYKGRKYVCLICQGRRGSDNWAKKRSKKKQPKVDGRLKINRKKEGD